MPKKYRNFKIETGEHPKGNKRFPMIWKPLVQVMEDGEWLGIKPKKVKGDNTLTFSFILADEGTYSISEIGAKDTIKKVKKLDL